MILTQLGRSDYRRMRWRNGLGWTSEIALRPAESSLENASFDWRLSLAEVDADCQFSRFPGYDRTIMLLSGEGMELRFGGADAALLQSRGQARDFPGGSAAQCRLLRGPCRDFNVMVRRGRIARRVSFRPLVGPMVFFAEACVTWAIHLVGGEAKIQNSPERAHLEAGDTLLLEPDGDSAQRCVISGIGEVVLVRLENTGNDTPAAA